MLCRCGYCFATEALKKPKPYDSFAVVKGKDYPKFLRSEIKLVGAATDKDRINAAWRSLKYVGTLKACPECGTLAWYKPGAERAEYFERVEESES